MKTFFLCLILLTGGNYFCTAQVEIEWQKTLGGNGNDELFSFQLTSDGGYICGGKSSSNISGDKSENNFDPFGAGDYWIIKLDPSGNIEWQKTLGGSAYDNFSSLKQTADGGYICGGSSNSDISGNKTEDRMQYDYWIVKLDSSGNIQWQNTIGGSNYDELYSIDNTSDRGFICGGRSRSSISGDKTEDWMGDWDYWVVKLDSAGNIQWQNTIGGNHEDDLWSIKQTADDGYICGGTSNSDSSGDKNENSPGDDWWIIKLDSVGNIQWQNTIGGFDYDILYSVQQIADGGYICGGWSYSNISGDKNEDSYGQFDLWIIKLDSTGNILWQNDIGGNGNESVSSIFPTSDGGYICGGGSSSNISGDKTENCLGIANAWILKLDSSGTVLWQNTFGGNELEGFNSVQPTLDGGFICGGNTYSDVSGDITEKCLGIVDYWVVKLTRNFNTITGSVFIDQNSNSVLDSTDIPLVNEKITDTISNRFTFSGADGFYSLSITDTGNFFLSPDLFDHYSPVPSFHTGSFNGYRQIDSLNNFAFQPFGIFNNLCVSLNSLSPFRPGFNSNYIIDYENSGNTSLSPIIIFYPSSDITFSSASIPPSSVTTDSVVWNLPQLMPFRSGNIVVNVHVNSGSLIGAEISSDVRIEPDSNNADPLCTYDFCENILTGGYDPNEIVVDEDSLTVSQIATHSFLEYIIRFQNTGNDTAFNVRVLNNIPGNLDANSFEFVSSSHPLKISYKAPSRLMTFSFDNILLQDSVHNEPASHGFIIYKIKPLTTLNADDSISNTAFIYFDFNTPVQTNFAITKVIQQTGFPEINQSTEELILFPNPAMDFVNCKLTFAPKAKARIRVYDLTGNIIYSAPFMTSNLHLETSDFDNGIYVIEVLSSEKSCRAMLVKY